jgi:hypothetical protein
MSNAKLIPIKQVLQNFADAMATVIEHPETPGEIYEAILDLNSRIYNHARETVEGREICAAIEIRNTFSAYCEVILAAPNKTQKTQAIGSRKPKKQTVSSRPALVQAA